ncbi:MAG: YfgM family protein [Desulfobulbus sp.]|jgi:predicted negative regulator of RcsB-dependent stress response
MTESNSPDLESIKLQPLRSSMGLLDQFNLPPKVVAFLRRNQRAIWIAVVTGIVAALGWAAVSAYLDHREAKASSALDAALLATEGGEKALAEVARAYDGTQAGLWADLELAFIAERAGQRAEAVDRLERINSELAPRSALKPLVMNKLAGLHESERRFDKALAHYTELSGHESFAADAFRAMGRINEALNKPAEAAAMYQKYLDATAVRSVQAGQQGQDPVRELVQSRLNQLKK